MQTTLNLSTQLPANKHEIVETFRNHINYFIGHGKGENALLGIGAEGSVTQQYAGRVLYELFQNALDNVDNSLVVVNFDGKTLLVGNRGKAISIDNKYDYNEPKLDGRSNFHALCALHASNKNPNDNFGNKGIGFRSIFGVADRVEVWSRYQTDHNGPAAWWGLSLQKALKPNEWTKSIDALIAEDKKIRIQHGVRPSFHFPKAMDQIDFPAPELVNQNLSTLICLQIKNKDHQDQIQIEVERLRNTRFCFIGLRKPGIQLLINGQASSTSAGWEIGNAFNFDANSAEALLAKEAEHPVNTPGVCIAWITEGAPFDEDKPAGLFYNYLPTELKTGLPIDVHADFQVKADRQSMTLDTATPIGKLNRALLKQAAKMHVERLAEEIRQDRPRLDFWRIADCPANGAPSEWREALKLTLFPNNSLEMWCDFAHNYFQKREDWAACDSFWQVSENWLTAIYGRSGNKGWKEGAEQLCNQLANLGTPLIPINVAGSQKTFALPLQEKSGQRYLRRVFFRNTNNNQDSLETDLNLPQSLIKLNRVVTTFNLGAFFDPAGIQALRPVALLPELRQINDASDNQRTQGEITPTEQGLLLGLAYKLLLNQQQKNASHFAWRAFASDAQWPVGYALATLFLPTIDEHWEPARQLSLEKINRSKLTDILPAALDLEKLSLEDFLKELGVAPAGAVSLLEGGLNGKIDPKVSPPEPMGAISIELERTRKEYLGKLPKIAPALVPGITTPESVCLSIDGLPDTEGGKSEIRKTIRETSWLPRDDLDTKGVPGLPDFIAPADVYLKLDPESRSFFASPRLADEHQKQILQKLGAVAKPDDENTTERLHLVLADLRKRIPEPTESLAEPSKRLALAALHRRLMHLLPLDEKKPRPAILIEQKSTYRWLAPENSEQAYLASNDDRQELRRFFNDLPLIIADYRKELAAYLGQREIKLDREIKNTPLDIDQELSHSAQKIHHEIDKVIPVLAAIADQSRLAIANLIPERILQAWRGTKNPIIEAHDVWIELGVNVADRKKEPWRFKQFDDVFCVPRKGQGDHKIIVFDTDPEKRSDTSKTLPLRYFGEAMALLLFNNRQLGPLFAQVFSAIDDDQKSKGGASTGHAHLDEYKERNHLTDLSNEWRGKLNWDNDLRPLLVQQLTKLCKDPEGALFRGYISRDDLLEPERFTNVDELKIALAATLQDETAYLMPRITISNDNRQMWDAFVHKFNDNISEILQNDSKAVNQLHSTAQAAFPLIAFDAFDFFQKFLIASGHTSATDNIGLRERLNKPKVLFTPPSKIVSLSQAGWDTPQCFSGNGKAGSGNKLTQDIVDARNAARGKKGQDAEKAFLIFIASETKKFEHKPSFESALLAGINNDKNKREFKEKLMNTSLEDALHIAEYSSSEGFDVLGLEEKDGKLQPVRYECKAISGDVCRAFISAHELAVARRVRKINEPGRWALVALRSDGFCLDLTEKIESLLVPDEEPVALRPLYDLGLSPDGLILNFNKG